MDSTSARPLLRSLCIQLRRIYDNDPNEVATDFKTLCKELLNNLQLATKGQSLVLFLDSLDQLTDEDNGRNLEWLPFELPSNVKIVVSTLPNEGGCLNKLQLSLPEETFVEVRKLIGIDPCTLQSKIPSLSLSALLMPSHSPVLKPSTLLVCIFKNKPRTQKEAIGDRNNS